VQPLRLGALLQPVAEQDEPGRHSLFPNAGVDGRNQGGTAFRLHLGGTLREDHNGQVSGRRKLLEAADNILEHLEPPYRCRRSLMEKSVSGGMNRSNTLRLTFVALAVPGRAWFG
jgi:hypothetical protein